MIIRDHGKTAFATLRDARGDIQLYFRQDTLTDREWQLFHLLDRGDIIGVDGVVFRTHTGEITVRVESYTILTKALRPLPDKWHGLTDKEQRYRMRYVDLIMNPEVRRTFETRTRMLKCPSIHFSSERSGHDYVPAYRSRTVSEETAGWRH